MASGCIPLPEGARGDAPWWPGPPPELPTHHVMWPQLVGPLDTEAAVVHLARQAQGVVVLRGRAHGKGMGLWGAMAGAWAHGWKCPAHALRRRCTLSTSLVHAPADSECSRALLMRRAHEQDPPPLWKSACNQTITCSRVRSAASTHSRPCQRGCPAPLKGGAGAPGRACAGE